MGAMTGQAGADCHNLLRIMTLETSDDFKFSWSDEKEQEEIK